VVDPEGKVYQFLDPMMQTPWTNGDIKSPDTTNPYVAAMVGSKYNPNEYCFLTIENVCYVSGGQRLTAAQLKADHAILSWASKLSGLPLDRKHVIGHYQVNGATRVNCPTVPADRQRVFDGVLGVEEEMSWVSQIKPVKPYIAVIGPDTNIRTAPYLDAQYIGWNTHDKAESPVTVVATVDGDSDQGSTEWLVYVLGTGGLMCVHGKQPIREEQIAGGYSEDQLNAKLQAATDPLRARIDSIKAKVKTFAADVADD
jgi:hypothetical protein